MPRQRSYTDDQLAQAIAASASWRGVLRELNLVATSAGAMRSVRARADHIGVNYRHFVGQRRWTEEQLCSAVATSDSWSAVTSQLGLTGRSAVATVKGHVARLGVDASHLSPMPAVVPHPEPDFARLGRAGALIAAAWYTLAGHDVSWPLEPSRFDLIVHGDQGPRRVQVKTTTSRKGDTWHVFLSKSRGERITYDPDEIDDFFIICGDLSCYLIPVEVVGGLHAISVRAYAQYRVASFIPLPDPSDCVAPTSRIQTGEH
ncbi:group I intron-associated PD-(D/E)XK endonuclease [Microbacterium sp. MC2]